MLFQDLLVSYSPRLGLEVYFIFPINVTVIMGNLPFDALDRSNAISPHTITYM